MLLALSVGLLSAAALAYEVLLLRLFSEVWWHSFAAIVISLALLGYGISGTLLSLAEKPLLSRSAAVYRGGALLFVLSIPGCFVAAQRLGFNPLSLAWSLDQWALFAAVYLVLSMPFLLVASCIGLALRCHGREIPFLYAADLAGAGLGAVAAVLLLQFLPPERCLVWLAMTACFAVVCGRGFASGRREAGPNAWDGCALILAGLLFVLPPQWVAPRYSEYKGLSLRLQVPGAHVLEQRWGPRGRVQVVDAGAVPYRQAAGMSLRCAAPIPAQLGVYVDGDLAGVLEDLPGSGQEPDAARYLECLPVAAPYGLLDLPRVAALRAGTGAVVRVAQHFGARTVLAVEPDPNLAELLRATSVSSGYAGSLRVVNAEARAFLSGESGAYDLIQLSTADGSPTAPPGIQSGSVDYLFTVEGFERMFARLAPGGLLAVTTGLTVPPREAVKVFGTAVAALERGGVSAPGRHLAWFRDWSTATLLVSAAPLSFRVIERLREFCAKWSFDLAYLPDLETTEANRFHALPFAYLREAANAILGAGRRNYYRRYPYFIEPATDDRPFFDRFFRWRLAGESWAARGRGGEGLLPWGYLLIPGSLLLACLAGLTLILGPLWLGSRVHDRRPRAAPGVLRVGVYFGCLGLGFLLIEVACLHRMSLLLGHPIYSAAAVLGSFLLFSGAGSRAAGLLQGRFPVLSTTTCWMVAGAAGLLQLVDPGSWAGAQSLSLVGRACVLLAAVGPVAFLMGMPFSQGLVRLSATWPEGIVWAWGINGCASVVSATLGTLIAIHLGLSTVVWTGVALYLLAGWSSSRW